jgi:hypothetical protein
MNIRLNYLTVLASRMKNLCSGYDRSGVFPVVECCCCSLGDKRLALRETRKTNKIARFNDPSKTEYRIGHSTWGFTKAVCTTLSAAILAAACSAQTTVLMRRGTSTSSYRTCTAEEKTCIETWPELDRATIPTLKHVRVLNARHAGSMANDGSTGTGSVSVPIPMTDVTGLMEALSQINNSIASLTAKLSDSGTQIPMSNVTGLDVALNQINNSITSLTATVNSYASIVQNLPSVPTFVDFETPVGTIDGSNATFALNVAPSPPSSLILHKNGVRLTLGTDYSLSGNTIVFSANAIPQPGDTVTAMYRLTSSSK